MAVNKTKELRNRDQLVGSGAIDYYFIFKKAKTSETLDLMADKQERENPADSQIICEAYEIRFREIQYIPQPQKQRPAIPVWTG